MNQNTEQLLQVLKDVELSAEEEMDLECMISKYMFDLLAPPQDQVKEWSFDRNGRQKYRQYIQQKTGQEVGRAVFDALYRHYVVGEREWRDGKKYKEIRGPRACAVCGSTADITVDHKIPIVCGGGNKTENLHYLCRSHNSRKNGRIAFVHFFEDQIA